jgi:hypothetical protein
VYLAYTNNWNILNRQRITQDEIEVMMQLGIYKYPRRYLAKIKKSATTAIAYGVKP